MSLLAAVLMLAVSGEEPGHAHHAPQLGKVAFETTCNAEADTQFKRGLAWLHSFGYQQAERAFSEAAAAEPACAIAHWGVAMSQFHPLWYPPTATELQKASAALAKARTVGAPSQQERDYVAALGAFYDHADTLPHDKRLLAYVSAMERLHRSYPEDREAAAFYALSLIAAGTLDDDPNYGRERKAGEILNALFKAEPDHPGLAHYLIHGFDYPALADLALPAARRYAGIAPDSSHAHHMPSHIFTRLGLWEEAIQSNRAAEASARSWSAANNMPATSDQRLHAMDYLTYAYLQTGQDSEAQRVLAELQAVDAVEPASQTAAFAVTAIPARVLLEQHQWSKAATFDLPPNLKKLKVATDFKWAQANVGFANAVGAARAGNIVLAREAVAKLAAIETSLVVPPGEYDWRKQVVIERQIAEAWLAFADGRKDEAVKQMRAVADLDDSTEKHPVTPGAILPAREQLGNLLLMVGRPAEALAEYEASLKRAPKRLASVYGAARSARLAGDSASANRYYAQVVELTRNGEATRVEIREAREFAARSAGR